MKAHISLSLLVSVGLFQQIDSHGRFIKPASRSSVWRDPNFSHLSPPQNYNDNELFCGSVHQTENPGTNCGVCGDALSSAKPRANEIGGRWYRGIITGNYESGQQIEVSAQITAAHMGFMEWRLCTNPSDETQECFDKYLLQRSDGQGSKVPVSAPGIYTTRLTLPQGVRCDHCVIQWNYRAGNNWGVCKDGSGALGCGPQETFRGCSDVRIS